IVAQSIHSGVVGIFEANQEIWIVRLFW
ncbi:MAG: hypothetical protein QOD75_1004, partial [Blastocatellia bacterium]|nr:hypothetical protein [Blastocatellia bacterium]